MPNFEAPESRSEAILQNMLGANNTLEPPQSRIEALLTQLLNSGGGGGGGTSGVLIINSTPYGTEGEEILDKTWLEIKTAMLAGTVCFIRTQTEDDTGASIFMDLITLCSPAAEEEETYYSVLSSKYYVAETETSYPIFAGEK